MSAPADQLPPILLAGCGKMGGALLRGWLEDGLAPSVVLDRSFEHLSPPHRIVRHAADIPSDFTPTVIILAAKPQKADALIAAVAGLAGPQTIVLSVMAGRTIASLRAAFTAARPDAAPPAFVRTMPNTPAAIGQGMTVACAPGLADAQRALCTRLLEAVGEAAWVENEEEVDAVTAVSGSGPGYVFLVAELLEKGAVEQGLSPELARILARQTVAGAGALLARDPQDAADLRRQVTSPGGTTQAALDVLMAPDALPDAFSRAIAAARARAAELAS